jgi:hypothetical protein
MEIAMPKYLIMYEGSMPPPPTPEAREQMMSAFMAWAGEVGEHMVDPGAPLGASRTVSSDGDTEEPSPIGGYTLLSADSLEEAVGLVRSHPFLKRGGTLRVSESVAP